jgi:catechol 2,3-dioxygenase-like lactoylglutathione lyase family enzyme
MEEMMTVLCPDHVTIAVANAATAIEFFELLGFRKQHVTMIDGGPPARYMGMPDMEAQHITLALEGAEPRFEIQLLEFDPRPPDDPGSTRRICGDGATTTLRSASTISGRPPATWWPTG